MQIIQVSVWNSSLFTNIMLKLTFEAVRDNKHIQPIEKFWVKNTESFSNQSLPLRFLPDFLRSLMNMIGLDVIIVQPQDTRNPPGLVCECSLYFIYTRTWTTLAYENGGDSHQIFSTFEDQLWRGWIFFKISKEELYHTSGGILLLIGAIVHCYRKLLNI